MMLTNPKQVPLVMLVFMEQRLVLTVINRLGRDFETSFNEFEEQLRREHEEDWALHLRRGYVEGPDHLV